MMAAAVLDVGRFEQSPSAQTLLYFLCYKVLGSISTKPAASPSPLALINPGGPWGGTRCSKSKSSVVIYLVS